jgi:hypothetical protein
MHGLIILLVLSLPLPVWAATYWVSQSASGQHCVNSSSNPGAGSSSQTIGQGLGCLGSGDTLLINSGTYNERIISGIPSGSGEGSRTIIRPAPGATVTMRPNFGDGVVFIGNGLSYITIQGPNFIFDGGSLPDSAGVMELGYGGGQSHHINLIDIELKNALLASNLNIKAANCDISTFHQLIRVNSHHAGTQPGLTGAGAHGMYLSSSDNLIQGGEFHDQPHGWGTQSYCDPGGTIQGSPDRNVFIGVKFYNNSANGVGLLNGTDCEVVNSLFYNNGGDGLRVNTNSSKVYNNTSYDNDGTGISCLGGSSADIHNNLSVSNGGNFQDCNNFSADDISSNNPNLFFVSAAGGDFRINTAGSPAVNAGVACTGCPTTDIEGHTRSAKPTIGAYEFAGGVPPIDPQGLVAWYKFDEGVGTQVNDSTTFGHTGLMNTAGWIAPGIIGPFAGLFNGSRYVQVTNTAGLKPSQHFGLAAWIRMTATDTNACDIATMGDSYALRIVPNGNLETMYYDGSDWPTLTTTTLNTPTNPMNPLSGTNHLVVATKDASGLRLWLNGAQVGFFATTGSIDYSLGANFQMGRHGNGHTLYDCTGVIDQVRVYDTFLTQTDVDNILDEQPTGVGFTMPNSVWTAANAPEGQLVSAVNGDVSQNITAPIGFRGEIRRIGSQVVEFFPPTCRSFHAGVWGGWTPITDSLGSVGVRLHADTVKVMGDQTLQQLLPTGGLTHVNGIFVESPMVTTFKITLGDQQRTEVETRLAFGAPLVAGDLVQCLYSRENGAPFDAYGPGSPPDSFSTLSLQGLQPPSSVHMGVRTGGVRIQ